MVVDVIDGRSIDRATAAQLADVENACRKVDSPHLEEESSEHLRLRLKHGWDEQGTPAVVVGRVDDEVQAFAAVELPSWDNTHMAFVELSIRPEHRATTIGDEILDQVFAVMKANDRTLLIANAWDGSDLERFWLDHGLEIASKAAQRRLLPPSLDWPRLDELAAEAVTASAEYEVSEVVHPVPDELVDDMVLLQLAMNDAPINDLAVEDNAWSPERFRGFESAMANRQMTSHRLVARHRDTGDLAGFTAVAVEKDRPHLGFQEDTAVLRDHRGHRLGLRLKIDMLRLLRDRHPEIRQIDTWNAVSNAHMIAVNDAIGCFVVGLGGELQRDLSKP